MNYFRCKYFGGLAFGLFVSPCYRPPLSESARERRIRKSVTQIISEKELVEISGFVSLRRSRCAREMNPRALRFTACIRSFGEVRFWTYAGLKIILGEPSIFHDGFLQPCLQSSVAVNRNSYRWKTSSFIAMVTAASTNQSPALAFQDFAKILARNGFHTSTSWTCASSGRIGGVGASR